MELRPIQFEPYKWLDEAVIFNKRDEQVPTDWIKEKARTIVLLFTAKDVDKDGIIKKFYEMYENVKYINLPIEVIYVPMDDSEEDMIESYKRQANWFTLKLHDPLVQVLKFMYGITSIPHMLVIKNDCTVISYTGLLDLLQHGKNAIITWLSDVATIAGHRKFSKETLMYGDKWRYLDIGSGSKQDYKRKFSSNEPKPL